MLLLNGLLALDHQVHYIGVFEFEVLRHWVQLHDVRGLEWQVLVVSEDVRLCKLRSAHFFLLVALLQSLESLIVVPGDDLLDVVAQHEGVAFDLDSEALAQVSQKGLLRQRSLKTVKLLLVSDFEVETDLGDFTHFFEKLVWGQREQTGKLHAVEALSEVRVVEEILATELLSLTALEEDVRHLLLFLLAGCLVLLFLLFLLFGSFLGGLRLTFLLVHDCLGSVRRNDLFKRLELRLHGLVLELD